jgi:glutathione S-transferase-like protein
VANDLLAAQFRILSAAEPDEVEKQRAALDTLLARFEEAISAGVLAEEAFGLIHVAVAPALHRFVVVEDRLGLKLLEGTPKLAVLARRLTDRPSVIETVPADFDRQFIQILVERKSFLVARTAEKRGTSAV